MAYNYSSLDALASNNILNFDVDAYVKGTTPRFYGKPEQQMYLPGDFPVNTMPQGSYGPGFNPYGMNPQPHKDKFEGHNPEKEHDAAQNIALATIAAVTGYVAGKATSISKLFKKDGLIGKAYSNVKAKALDFTKKQVANVEAKTDVKADAKVNAGSDVAKAVEPKIEEKVADEIKDVAKEAPKKKTGIFSKIKGTWGKIPKFAKIGGGVVAGLYVAGKVLGAVLSGRAPIAMPAQGPSAQGAIGNAPQDGAGAPHQLTPQDAAAIQARFPQAHPQVAKMPQPGQEIQNH